MTDATQTPTTDAERQLTDAERTIERLEYAVSMIHGSALLTRSQLPKLVESAGPYFVGQDELDAMQRYARSLLHRAAAIHTLTHQLVARSDIEDRDLEVTNW